MGPSSWANPMMSLIWGVCQAHLEAWGERQARKPKRRSGFRGGIATIGVASFGRIGSVNDGPARVRMGISSRRLQARDQQQLRLWLRPRRSRVVPCWGLRRVEEPGSSLGSLQYQFTCHSEAALAWAWRDVAFCCRTRIERSFAESSRLIVCMYAAPQVSQDLDLSSSTMMRWGG